MSQNVSNPADLPTQRGEGWNAISAGWHEWIPHMRMWYAPATNLMLDLADMGPGDRILDIAAGDCDQSIAAAERVGPDGYILAIDLAEDMLEIGAKLAADTGLSNIETRVMDGQNLNLPENSFDAAICRFGLMFFPNPSQTIRGIARVLKPTGRVAVVIYQDDGEPEFTETVSTIREHLNIPQNPVSAANLGSPERLHEALEAGGLHDVETHLLILPIRLNSADDCVRYLQSTSPTIASLISDLGPSDRRNVWEKVLRALQIYETDAGFRVDHKVIVGAGRVDQANSSGC